VTMEEAVFCDCDASYLGCLPIEIGGGFVDPATCEARPESHLVTLRAKLECSPKKRTPTVYNLSEKNHAQDKGSSTRNNRLLG
jgi:hypothetical protein